MQPESRLKVKALEMLRSLPNSWFVKVQMLSIMGIPDILGCVNGRFVAWELKKSKKDHPEPLQQRTLNLIAKAGGVAEVVYPENLDQKFQDLLNLGS